MRICVPWSVSSPRVLEAWLRSDGSFEYQFLQRVMLSAVLAVVNSVRLTVCLTVCLSVTRWYQAKTTQARIMRSSLEDSPMILVS